MQIVIDISEEVREHIFDLANDGNEIPLGINAHMVKAIVNGTPLPKGHGDIVDIETLIDMFWDGNSMEITKYDLSVIEPIIEADKKGEIYAG